MARTPESLVPLPSSLVGAGSPAGGGSGLDDTPSILFDSRGSPVPSGLWASALSVRLHSVCSVLCRSDLLGWAVALGLGLPWLEPCCHQDLASELIQSDHHFLTQVMSWSVPGLIQTPPCWLVTLLPPLSCAL